MIYCLNLQTPIFGYLVWINYLQLWCINASHQMLECLIGFLLFSGEIQLLFYWNQIRISRKMNVPTSEKNVKIHSFNDLAIPIGSTRQRLMRHIKRFWESECANILLPRFSTQPNSKYENIGLQFNTTEKLQQNPISNAIVKNRKKKKNTFNHSGTFHCKIRLKYKCHFLNALDTKWTAKMGWTIF